MEQKDRLIAARRHLGLTQKAMAKTLNIDEKTWQRVELGKGDPSAETIRQLVRHGFDANWILEETGRMLLDGSGFGHLNDAPSVTKSFRGKIPDDLALEGYVLIPRYDVSAAAGTGAVVDEEPEMQSIAFKREWLHREFGANPADLVVMSSSGDSNYPRLKDKDLMLIDRSEPKLRGGSSLYAFSFDGLLYVKRLEKRLDGGLMVVSENDEVFPPELIGPDRVGEVNIIGRLLWSAGKV